MIEIMQVGRFYGVRGFDFPSLKEALQVQEEGWLFFADEVIGLMVAMPPCPTADWQKHPSRSRFNEEGWYETNLQEYRQDFLT